MKKEIEGFLKCLQRRTVQVTAVSYIGLIILYLNLRLDKYLFSSTAYHAYIAFTVGSVFDGI